MTLGALGPNAKGALFWAPEAYYETKVCNFFTEGDALKNEASAFRRETASPRTAPGPGAVKNANSF
mgnify:CR=1 FL=1